MRVNCLAQEHNSMSPAKTRTRTTRSESSTLTMRPPRLPGGIGGLEWKGEAQSDHHSGSLKISLKMLPFNSIYKWLEALVLGFIMDNELKGPSHNGLSKFINSLC